MRGFEPPTLMIKNESWTMYEVNQIAIRFKRFKALVRGGGVDKSPPLVAFFLKSTIVHFGNTCSV